MALVGPTITNRARIATATLGSILFLASCGTTPTGVISGVGPDEAPSVTRAPSTQPTATPRPVTSTVTDTDTDDLATSAVTDVGDAATELPIELVALDNIDLDAVFRRGCLAWDFANPRDHSAINDPIANFLDSGRGELDGDVFDLKRIQQAEDRLTKDACRAETALEGWISLSQSLGLTNAEFSDLVDASCMNYSRSQSFRNERAGQHRFILQVVGVDDLTDLIDQICDGIVIAV